MKTEETGTRDEAQAKSAAANRRLSGLETLEARRLLTVAPTTVHVTPNDATVEIDTSILLVGRYADADGASDISLVDLQVFSGDDGAPRCYARYDSANDLLSLWGDTTGLVVVGSPGSNNSGSNGDCTLHAATSSVATVGADNLDVTFDLSLSSVFEGDSLIWMRAYDSSGLESTVDIRGDITVVAATVETTVTSYYDDRPAAMALNYDTELFLCGMVHSLSGYNPDSAADRAQKTRIGWPNIIDDAEANDIPVSFNICGTEAVFGDAGRPEYAALDVTYDWHPDPHWATNTWYSDAPENGGDYKTIGELAGETRSYELIYGGDLTERAMNSDVPFEISYHNFGHESLQFTDEAGLDATFALGVEYHKRIGSKITAEAAPWNHSPQPEKYDIYGQNGIFTFNRRETSTGEPYEVVEDLWVVPRNAFFDVNTDLSGSIDGVISSGHVFAPYSHPEDGFESASRPAFQNSLAYAKTKVDSGELWATTLSEISRYWEAKSDVSVTSQISNGKTIVDISLADYNVTTFGIPYLTFKSPMPDGSSHAKITVDYPSNQTLNSASSRIENGEVIYTIYLNPSANTHVEIEGVATPYAAGVDTNEPILSIDSTVPVNPTEAIPIIIQATSASTDAVYSANLIYQRNDDAKVALELSNNGGTWETSIGPFDSGDSISYYVSVTDNSGRREISEDKVFSVSAELDVEPPEWRSQGQSDATPELGNSVQLFAEGRDNSALRFARLETNETGVWAEHPEYGSPKNLGDVANTWVASNFTWFNAAIPGGTTVSWRVRYEDAAGNETVTNELSFQIESPFVDDQPPQYSVPNVAQVGLITSAPPSYTADFNLDWTDNVGLDGYIFSFDDGSGTFVDEPYTQFTAATQGGGPWWDNDWSHRKEITIDNTANSNSLTDYAVLVTVDTASLISEGKLNVHGGDLRFVDGSEELEFWVESDMNSAATRIWVKIPLVAAASTKQIAMYYGNENRTVLRSDGANTFPVFDNFGGRGWEEFKYENNPIRGPVHPSGQGAFSSVIRESDGTWKMYSSFDEDENDISLATSTDGLNWVRQGVVLRTGSTGEWDSIKHWAPVVWQENGVYNMLHPAEGPEPDIIRMGWATSPDGVTWTKYDDPTTTAAPYAESDPVFNDPVWATDDTEAACFSVVKESNTYYVMYNTLRMRRMASIASSTDLINWTPVYEDPRFEGGESTVDWNYHMFCGHAFEFEDEYYLLIPGQDALRDYAKFGLYVSSSPEFPENDTEFKGIVMVGGRTGWDSQDMDTPWIVPVNNNKVHLYYEGCGTCHTETGVAVIDDFGLALTQAYAPGNYYDIDRDITGSQRIMPPVGWEKSFGGYVERDNQNYEIVLDQAVTGRAVARLDNNPTKPLSIHQDMSEMDQGVVSAWLRASNNNTGDYDLYVYGDAQTELGIVAGLGGNGNFHYWNGAFVDTGVAYSAETWYRVEVEFDVSTNTYNFVVFDASFAELVRVNGIGFGQTVTSGIDRVSVRTSSSFNGTGYVDDVLVRPRTATQPGITLGPESSSALSIASASTTKEWPFQLITNVRWKYTAQDTSGNQTESEIFSDRLGASFVAAASPVESSNTDSDSNATNSAASVDSGDDGSTAPDANLNLSLAGASRGSFSIGTLGASPLPVTSRSEDEASAVEVTVQDNAGDDQVSVVQDVAAPTLESLDRDAEGMATEAISAVLDSELLISEDLVDVLASDTRAKEGHNSRRIRRKPTIAVR